jgi:hypothetical protein
VSLPGLEILADSESFEIDTQLWSYDVEAEDQTLGRASDESRFDLVLKQTAPVPAVAVIECKVSFDRPENIVDQLNKYRIRMHNVFARYGVEHRMLLLLTPYSEKYTADAHVSWSEVCDSLREVAATVNSPTAIVLRQFEEFLIDKKIAKMKIQPFCPVLPKFREVARMLHDLQDVLESLRNDEELRIIFSKNASVPKLDLITDGVWYGIWSRGARPTYYAGFEATGSREAPLQMYAQVQVQGNGPKLPMPKELKAICDWQGGDEKGTTSYVFKRAIDPEYDGNRARIEGWFTSTLRAAKRWVDSGNCA